MELHFLGGRGEAERTIVSGAIWKGQEELMCFDDSLGEFF